MMRSCFLFVALFAIGCGSRVTDADTNSPDAATDAARDTAVSSDTRPAVDAPIPSDCTLRDNACFQQMFAAYERMRTCFAHLGGACGKLQPDDTCIWPDGAKSEQGPLPGSGEVGILFRSPSGTECMRSQFVGGGTGFLEFADGTRFAIDARESDPRVTCADGTSFVIRSSDDACGNSIQTCCE